MPDCPEQPKQLTYHPELKPVWTTETLLLHIEVVLKEMNLRYEQRFKAAQEALEVARQSMERRLEGMNEFRAQLDRQVINFLTKEEYIVRHESLIKRIEETAKRDFVFLSKDEYASRHELLVQRLDIVTSRLDRLEARKEGLSATWAWIFAGIGATVGLLTLLYELLLKK